MAAVEIRKFDDPILRRKAKPVKRVNSAVRAILDQMAETLAAANGVGLAGPQIGVERALVVIDAGEGLLQLVNPRVVESEGTVTAVEGCLSLPGMYGEVPRAGKVKVEALDAGGHRIWVEGEGLLARALQHEIDHLDGILFIDKATSITMEEEEGGEGEHAPPEEAAPLEPSPRPSPAEKEGPKD